MHHALLKEFVSWRGWCGREGRAAGRGEVAVRSAEAATEAVGMAGMMATVAAVVVAAAAAAS
jgi:hypothetical protein